MLASVLPPITSTPAITDSVCPLIGAKLTAWLTPRVLTTWRVAASTSTPLAPFHPNALTLVPAPSICASVLPVIRLTTVPRPIPAAVPPTATLPVNTSMPCCCVARTVTSPSATTSAPSAMRADTCPSIRFTATEAAPPTAPPPPRPAAMVRMLAPLLPAALVACADTSTFFACSW